MQTEVLFKSLKQLIKEYSETYHNFKDEDLFTLWFLRAYVIENEQEAAKAVVNEKKDKGIDGIYIDDNAKAVFIVQTKYRKSLQKGNEKASDVKQFAQFGNILGRDDLSSFKTFIEEADELVKDRLSQARKKLNNMHINSGFIM